MKPRLFALFALFALFPPGGRLAAQAPLEGAVERLDPALDAILSTDAKLEVIRRDYFGAAEGPTWFKDGQSGYLLFSDMAANRIYKWDPAAGQLSTFLEKSGYSGADITDVRALDNGRMMVAVLGSNGLAQDREGRLVFCTHGDRSVVRLEKDGTRTTLADRYENRRLNGPNDLVVKSDGSIYFTDLGAGLKGGAAKSPDRELDFQGTFRWKPGGDLQLVAKNGANGIALSPDERYLFVTGGGGIMRYALKEDGTTGEGQLHLDMRGQKLRGNADGIRVDHRGYLFTSGPGGAWIADATGKHIGTVYTPDKNATDNATSVAFGDIDGKGLYITTLRSVYRIRMRSSAW
ncbi:MAG TPA: SMP-30/gluconolactonase/LRE family protein [Vicinamibacterales bacterium]|jgi:gluconolactonase|nr:SMP-30/gluconolactonase/LRE family protein [Vicinamibacterales bacterium]